GTERVVSFLTEELVTQRHDVTLFASGDSITTARLVPVCEKALRLNDECVDQVANHIAMLQMVMNEIENFDVIHYHIDYLHYPLSKKYPFPHVTTLHGRLNIYDLKVLYQLFDDMPVISISQAQRSPLPWLNWVGNVYHGLPLTLFEPNYREGKYLAFLGRVSPEKGLDRAIEIAISSGIQLKIAAKIDNADKTYFEQHIKHLLDHPLIDFVGEIGEHEKQEFLSNAIVLLFPIDWPEPFGLVMTEAMACGTPVIAYSNGSVPEIIEHGKNGFIVENQEQAIKAVQNISLLDRQVCRTIFEERFSSQRMAKEYVSIYENVIGFNGKRKNIKPIEV
ncbi:MAG TPA: glycosyltransferase family 4 protein, partial [Chryseolinea sp.]|nr:glycosyltransferase family 4 protein [Chryseolinea sp.]